ncbi:MAG TPA: nuclear transport factor 2 family protein [Pyrinomonadaceae bacterium]|jgi:predicted SnoaL-like aldol condensation-catalyzing enzyme|nr:nuclear transport factor 2 family protein [Pyrinomonadaceae bacterium]
MSASATISHKNVATSFMQLVASGKVREAFQNYVDPNFRHHNPLFRGDAESLRIAMEENAAQHPDKVLEIQHVLEDRDVVAVHSRIRQTPDDRGAATVHIFRFHGNRVIELWDVGQPVLENSPNENGMF